MSTKHSTYVDNLYLKRLNDLEKPLPEDSPFFLPPRPIDTNPENGSGNQRQRAKGGRTFPPVQTAEERARQQLEYQESVKLPATTTLNEFPSETITEVMGGRGWIVPNLLSPEECDELIQVGEDWGIHPDTKSRGRTSSRTNNYINEELSARLNQRLPEALLEAVEGTMPYSSVRGIHPNWRVARYREGETFPAHQDQSDFVTAQHPTRGKQRFTSTHTLLINLRSPGEDFQGGATRFFVEGSCSISEGTVDICVPKGWGLVFEQKGLFHAGLPIKGDGVKYIAQAGVLRGEPQPGVLTGPTATFKYAPGVENNYSSDS